MLTLCLSVLVVGQVSTATAAHSPQSEDPPLDPHRLEIGVIPGIAIDSALGLGLANLLNLARLEPGIEPYKWRLQALTAVFLHRSASGSISPTLQLYRFSFDTPQLSHPRLRLLAQASFSRMVNAGYYGIGNASVAQTPWDGIDPEAEPDAYAAAKRFHEYDRIFGRLRALVRVDIGGDWELFSGGSLSWNWTNLYPDSLLQREQEQSNIVGLERHGQLEGTVGLLLDTRDDEIAPSQGGFHELSLRAGRLVEIDGVYGGINLTLRHFVGLLGPRLVLATRVVADVLFGDAPLYELSRIGGLLPQNGPAGPTGIRGPRAQRYHGKVKIYGNLELRSRLISFRLFGLPTHLGLVGFIDAGRVWAELRRREIADGTGVGLKWATGGGFRYQWGRSLVVRGDLGWSADGVLFSVDANHIF